MNREILVKLATIMQTYFPENTDEAIDCYEKLLEFDIDTAQIYYELGHLYMAKEDKLNSVSAFKLAVEREPENPFFNNSLGYAYAKAELYDDAIEHYQKQFQSILMLNGLQLFVRLLVQFMLKTKEISKLPYRHTKPV